MVDQCEKCGEILSVVEVKGRTFCAECLDDMISEPMPAPAPTVAEVLVWGGVLAVATIAGAVLSVPLVAVYLFARKD